MVIIDRDLLADLDLSGTTEIDSLVKMIPDLVRWLVHQVQLVLRRKRIDLLEKKPGAVTGCPTTTIFVKILRRIGHFNEKSRMAKICALRAKFNDALNDAVAKVDQRILTINSCNMYEDFERDGNFSRKGRIAFRQELDNLIERFDMNKIKLLPNPKNPPQRTHTLVNLTSHRESS